MNGASATNNNSLVQSSDYPSATDKVNTKDAADVTSTDAASTILSLLAPIVSGTQTNFVDPYIKIVRRSTEYMSDLTALMALIAKNTVKGTGGKDVDLVGETEIRGKITALMTKYNDLNLSDPLFLSQGTGDAGKEEALRWAKELKLPESDVAFYIFSPDKNNPQYILNMDPTELIGISDALKFGSMTTLQYQTMDNAIAGFKTAAQSDAQIKLSGLTDAQSQLDSMAKQMVNIQDAIFQAMRAMFQSLA